LTGTRGRVDAMPPRESAAPHPESIIHPARLPKRGYGARVRVAFALGALAVELSAATGVTGCGRRATHADCQLIVHKSVELGMKEMSLTSEPAIRKREERVREELQAQIASCEGLRVTDRMMGCVRVASTSKELDRCLR
jgi:hypothetical protein